MVRRALGFGFGLRPKHFSDALSGLIVADCVEIIAENFAGRGGRPRAALERVRRDCPVLVHSVGLDVGGMDPVDTDHVRRVAALADEIEASSVSDHLCFSRLGGGHGHDLWPLPRTRASLERVAARIRQIQDLLRRPLVLENVSAYIDYAANEMDEPEYWAELFVRTGCTMLLDVNNAYVTATNVGGRAEQLLDRLPAARISQIHLAGHAPLGAGLLDDHGSAVADVVWDLYRRVTARVGPVTTIIERDTNVPPALDLMAEAARARAFAEAA
jgi:hypothetical protein